MKKILIILGFLISQTILGQVTITENEKKFDGNVAVPDFDDSENDKKIYNSAEIEIAPEFPGGMLKFQVYLSKFYKYQKEEKISGKIIVSFIIEKDGGLTNIKVLKDFGYGTKEETIRLLTICPKWKPAMLNGKPVRCTYTLPITIQSSN